MTYRLINQEFMGVTEQCLLKETADGVTTHIPFALGNTDYQEYLAWLAEGNEPLPADEPS